MFWLPNLLPVAGEHKKFLERTESAAYNQLKGKGFDVLRLVGCAPHTIPAPGV
jgi:hypothetical protein